MSILCIGQVAYDITFSIDGEIVENQKYRIEEKTECLGGPAGNASYLCALWGCDTSLMARVGSDIYGKRIMEILKDVGVKRNALYKDDNFSTSISGIIANHTNGSRTIFNCPGKLDHVDFEYPDEIPDVILVDGHELDASYEALKRYPNAISIVDAGTCRESTMELSKRVDYLICSEDFAYQYTGIKVNINNKQECETVFKLLSKLNQKHIAITLGEKGLLFKDEAGIHHMLAYPVKAVDTCGAGDIFHGAFAYCLEHNYSFEDSLKISSITASISVESYGGQISIPLKDTVNKRLKFHQETVYLK